MCTCVLNDATLLEQEEAGEQKGRLPRRKRIRTGVLAHKNKTQEDTFVERVEDGCVFSSRDYSFACELVQGFLLLRILQESSIVWLLGGQDLHWLW
eukprot:2878937-Amphidinium_carterae.2